MQKRIMKCDICEIENTETGFGTGFPGWGSIWGITRTDSKSKTNDMPAEPRIDLCPTHLSQIAQFLTTLEKDIERERQHNGKII